MKTHSIASSAIVALLFTWLGASPGLSQPVALSGTSYSQDFTGLDTGLPPGWDVRTAATATNAGTVTTFTLARTAWLLSAGIFSNMASSDNTDTNGAPFTGANDANDQAAATNRAPGVRLNGGIDPGAAFVLRIQDTLGFQNFILNLDLMTLTTFARTSIWTIAYAVGASPTSFTPLGTYSDLTNTFFGKTNRTFALPADVDDQGENLWIRVANVTAVSQSGNRDAFGIDNVSLIWTNVPPSTEPPTINNQPQSRTNNASTTATFTVDASGATPLFYRWRKGVMDLEDGGNISGATSPTLVISNVVAADEGNYFVFVTNNFGSLPSMAATLTVIDPAVIAPPEGRTNVVGDNVILSADFAGTPPLTFQWRHNGTNIPGAAGESLTILTNVTLAITNFQATHQGPYTLVASNSFGMVTSAVANLILLATPSTRIVTWNFNSNLPDDDPTSGVDTPSLGTGTAAAAGTSPAHQNGTPSDPASLGLDNSGWNITDFAPQGNENKLRGVQFSASTVGYQDILLTWEERHSARASRYVRLQYTTNGVDFIDHDVFDLGGQQNEFVLLSSSLSGVLGVNSNASFGFRIVAELENTAIGTMNTNYVPTDPTQSYGTSGSIRFDMVNVFGNALGTVVPTITQIAIVGGNVQIDFAADAADAPGDFTLQSSGTVNGTYGDVASTRSQLSPGIFRAERALDGSQQFYRIRR